MPYNLMHLLPEIFLLTAGCVILLVDVFSKDLDRNLTYRLTQLALLATAIICMVQFPSVQYHLYERHFILDPMAGIIKISVIFLAMLALLFARPYILPRRILRGEYYLLHLFAVLGMMVLVSGGSLLTLYLGLELLSLSLYALVAMQRHSYRAAEAAVKYFVMGAIASGFLLYGMSLVYGVTQHIHLTDIANYIATNDASLTLRFGLVFIVVAIGFKFGAVPFQMWVPDVYDGAPTSTTAFLSSAPKVAAFGFMVRIFAYGFIGALVDWQGLLIILACLSMLIGNIVALVQNNLKRLLAYSAIAHMGYFLLGALTGTSEGFAASFFYILAYSIMSLGGFGCLIYLGKGVEDVKNLDQLKGLGRSNPWGGLLISVLFLSMAGLPPFIGFWAKLEVFLAVLNAGFVWLAVFAAVMSIIGLFYYLKVVKVIFFDESEKEEKIVAVRGLRLGLGITSLSVVALGLFPGKLMQLCAQAFEYL
ncbi:NADH-quinone oxidoreductase subunit NuoN [Kangiella spongicola]|uniref:NADH-quinone oxidoreductase subunit N n=1 Tax=Kangiella spongicola TaxID=796379 RepID=A0A318D5I4_9GAMM|nr:NADH-quinone oxidoreductase subunit NuoN [Kangiella spongicola]MBV35253.1 NADH-quinone oxidoreductase subunit NuoN [Rickettsiales bacterium]PXF64526.1 NADH-quinone oxidoreductase subunit NuoN [Kangiella spongicola]